MVFAVNPTTNQTVAQFQANAKNASSSSTTPSGSSGDSSGTATGTDAAASSTDTGTAANSNAITTAVVDNVGFITVLAIVGGFILALWYSWLRIRRTSRVSKVNVDTHWLMTKVLTLAYWSALVVCIYLFIRFFLRTKSGLIYGLRVCRYSFYVLSGT